MITLFPYKEKGVWMFDDQSTGLKREAFVLGIDEMLDVLTAKIPNATQGCKLTIAKVPFPTYQVQLDRRWREGGGRWYHWQDKGMIGWLCPALFKYFAFAPKKIFARVDAIPLTT